jgi:hypothetical protein
MEIGASPLHLEDRDIRRQSRVQRVAQNPLRQVRPPIGAADHLAGGVDPSISPAREGGRLHPPEQAGQRRLDHRLDRSHPGCLCDPAKSVPS